MESLLITVLGIIAGVFTTIAVLPQVFKVIKTKSAEDISIWMFVCLLIGVGSWTLYGIVKEDWPIIITNGLSVLFNGIMVYIKLKYSK
ncbi:SemiSWEET family sugar transporter [Leeuwenhoekiella sp. MAR_2009_132]|uniref:SemiSWEET family sugar transporter n=1 Tax=Leeuwenhoekiella sp. MAR_2009_132 TaxID=1392489 RepID=UPI00048C40C2|nr:SemiSWEET transporter [Leeuwenhoekiella sp. MAR_2009_132]